ncbi:DUF6220 domain-containing protein [Nocardia brevicatena]|uniref:DUF6220 domain-containing protein n=1 Tax=Nocardia brevicatena TaxID=37327 RepID=UPI0002F5587A|nr:DUF6220 domain-containing protein [Nocardia brevicatena]
MKRVFAGLATLLLLAVVTQFYLAASGAFDTAPNEESFHLHRALGNAILLFSVVLTITAAIAWMPGRLVGSTGLVAGLVVLQSVIREVAGLADDGSSAGHFVFGLHAVNGLVIIGVLGMVVRQSRRMLRQPDRPARTAS